MLANVAYVFHFAPRDLWELEFDELLFWHEQAVRLIAEVPHP